MLRSSNPLPFDPHPSALWTLDREGKSASCEVAFVPIGTEVRIFRNASLLMSRIVASGSEALTWAEEERQHSFAADGRRQCERLNPSRSCRPPRRLLGLRSVTG